MKTLETRFWEKVEKTEDCWLWKGAIQNKGYGQIRVGKKIKYAHRISYELIKESIPEGMTIDHLCFVTNCVNPLHLEVVTMSENIKRSRGRIKKTHCKNGHLLSEENTYKSDTNRNVCIICHRLDRLSRYYKNKALKQLEARGGSNE